MVQKLERLRRASALQIQERINKRKNLRNKIIAVKTSKIFNGVSGKVNDDGEKIGDLTGEEKESQSQYDSMKREMFQLTLEKNIKLKQIGFRFAQDFKGRVAVRSINVESMAYTKCGIRDGFVLRYVGDFDTQQESVNSTVRLLRTQPRPVTLFFEHLKGGVSLSKELKEEDDPDMI